MDTDGTKVITAKTKTEVDRRLALLRRQEREAIAAARARLKK